MLYCGVDVYQRGLPNSKFDTCTRKLKTCDPRLQHWVVRETGEAKPTAAAVVHTWTREDAEGELYIRRLEGEHVDYRNEIPQHSRKLRAKHAHKGNLHDARPKITS